MTPTNKNLQDLFKTYVAKSDGEEKFRKAHVISTVDNNDEKLGPKDDQFVATTKTYARDASHHGYEAGGDEKVYSEEVNQTDRDKAIAHYKADLPNILKDIRGKRKSHSDLRREYGGSWKRLANSTADEHGHNYNRDHLLAVGKQHLEDHASQINEMSSKMKMKLGLYGKKKKMEEEADYSEKGDAERIRKRQEGWQKTFDAEKAMEKKAAAIKHADEFVKRYNKKKMEEDFGSALVDSVVGGAKIAARKLKDAIIPPPPIAGLPMGKNGEPLSPEQIRQAQRKAQQVRKEEVEELDEVSKAKLGRYINKAKDSIDMTSYRSGIKDGTAISRNDPYTSKNPLERKLSRRHKGIEMAVKKLTKEDVEQIDELSVVGLDKYHSKAYQSMFDKDSDKKTVAKRKKGMDTAYNKAGFGKAKVYATEEAELVEATLNPEDERHFEKQPPKMQAAINLHLRKGMDYEDAVAAARRVFNEDVEQTDKLSIAIKKKLSDEGGAAAFKPLKDTAMKMGINLTPEMLKNMPGVSQHDDGDYILKEESQIGEGEERGGGYDGMPKGLQDRTPRGSSRGAMGRAIARKERNLTRARMDRAATKMEEAEHTNCGTPECCGQCDTADQIDEKKLTKAELAKREEVAAAMERENPGMDMGKKMAIATAQAKKVAEEIELGEAVDSDDAFDRLEKAGAKDAKTTSGGIRYTHGGKEYNLRHNMKRTGHRTVRTAELEQHLNRLQEETEVVEEQFAPGKFKEAMIQRGLAALQEHVVGNE